MSNCTPTPTDAECSTYHSVLEQLVPVILDWNDVAARALSRIDLKLNGVFLPWRDPRFKQHGHTSTKELPTNALVDMLLRESMNETHLVRLSFPYCASPCIANG